MKKKESQTTDWKEFFRGKKITVMGLGLLGRGVGDVVFLAKYAKEIIVTDLKTKEHLKDSLKKIKHFKNIRYTLGKHELKDFEKRDLILKAAGVPLKSPFIDHAKKKGVPVYMSTALFAKFAPATIVGITGTRGKTTVTYMIHEVLTTIYRSKKKKVFIGGNIRGMSTLALLPKAKEKDIVVLELDSWQLQGFGDLKISPNVGVFTTFMPDHLNYYGGSLKLYCKDKAQIFLNQKKDDVFIVSRQAKKAIQKYSRLPKETVVADDKKNIPLRIPGSHNQLNAALAFETLKALKVPSKKITEELSRFRGVEGRLEFLAKKKGVSIYNDTTATTPHASASALKALGKGENISLIMGGAEKHIELSVLKPLIKKHCAWVSVLSGMGSERLLKEKIIDKNVPYKVFSSFEEAVKEAYAKAPKKGVLLLSPAFASFGMFKNEYDRGDQFNKFVKKLK